MGSIGDHLIALPVYRAIRAQHAESPLVLISNVPASGNPKLVGPAGILPPTLFDDIRAYPALSGWRNFGQVIRLFRDLGLTHLYYLMPKRTQVQFIRDSLVLPLLAGRIIGLNRAATEPVRPLGEGLYEHEADRLARAVGLGQANRSVAALSLEPTETELARIRSHVGNARGTVVMSVGTKCEVKHWGADNWRQLTERLGSLPGLEKLILVGSADEYQECEQIRTIWPRQAVNLCGQLSARESAALMAASELFIGHDSGPMHLAAAANVPLVAIFSSRAPRGMWFPLSARHRVHYTEIDCMGCGLERCVTRQKACIAAISVDEVFESCWSLLQQVRRQEQMRQPAARIMG